MISDPWGDGDVVPVKHPPCCVCRKESDAARQPWVGARAPSGALLYLCGTHFDEWLQAERTLLHRLAEGTTIHTRFAAWAKGLREGKYRSCWEAAP